MSDKTPSINLAKHIGQDLLTVGRWPLIMMMCAFGSAMWIVHTTHDARQAIHQRDNALTERDRLDNEWRNLILEENALSEHTRVQQLAATELDMRRPDADKEVIVSLK